MQIPTQHFDGLDIIFCGDLYQAEPIHDSPVFQTLAMDTELMPYDFWQENIKCYNLQTTMRQKDEIFITILNKIHIGSETKNDTTYLNKQCFHSPPSNPLFPFLFYRKEDVNKHNQKILSNLPRQLIIINTIDEHHSFADIDHIQKHSGTLPNQIMLKKDILVEIYGRNYDIKDGLVNGTDGKFKAYTWTIDMDIIWVQFSDHNIGKSQVTKLSQFNQAYIDNGWIPIL